MSSYIKSNRSLEMMRWRIPLKNMIQAFIWHITETAATIYWHRAGQRRIGSLHSRVPSKIYPYQGFFPLALSVKSSHWECLTPYLLVFEDSGLVFPLKHLCVGISVNNSHSSTNWVTWINPKSSVYSTYRKHLEIAWHTDSLQFYSVLFKLGMQGLLRAPGGL